LRSDCPVNIVLIGMPGAGKSSIGVLLAKRLGYDFIDTDLLIQVEAHCRLQQIIVHHGLEAFKDLEERVICKLAPQRAVIATGGSVVYSAAAMTRLQQIGRLVFLDLPLPMLQQRIRTMYRHFAELTIPCGELAPEEIAAAIEGALCGTTN